jgi:hypothetical protein
MSCFSLPACCARNAQVEPGLVAQEEVAPFTLQTRAVVEAHRLLWGSYLHPIAFAAR